MTEPAAAPSPAKSSRWEDFIDVFFSPAELFRRRAEGDFGLALLIFFIAATALYFATRSFMAPVFDAEWQRAIPAMLKTYPNLTAEQIAAAKDRAQTFGGVVIIVAAPIAIFLLGAVVWMIGRVLGAPLRYVQGATIATFAMFPRLVESLVNAVQATFMDERSITSRLSVSLGVGRFLSPDQTNPLVMAFLGRIDLFTIWVTVLIAVGFKVIGKRSTGQAAIGAVLVWLIGSLPTLYQAYRTM